MRREREVTVYEVLFEAGSPGPAGDGTHVYRSRSRAEAERFAVGRELWGRPATVQVAEGVPVRLAARWGLA